MVNLIQRLRNLTPKLRVAWFALLLVLMAHHSMAAASAKELLASGHVDEVIRMLHEQIGRSPSDAEAYNLLCRAHYMIEEWDPGIAACERAVNLDARSSLYALWLGRIYGEKADHSGFMTAVSLARRARASFERAVELDPGNVQARADLGEFYAEAPAIIGGGKDKARQQAEALMSLNPAMGHWVLARIAEKDKDPALAEREYRAEIAASRGGVRGWLDLANFLKYAQRYDEMEEALRQMQTAPVDHPESIMHAGNLLLRAERNYPLATQFLRRYLAAPVEEGPACRAHNLLGLALEKQGNHEGAVEELRAALALAHSYAHAQQDLKRLEHS
jgi:tetratricopeptide (TPR) repeat protein